MSAMRKDGAVMYRNRSVAAQAEIDGQTYPVDDILRHHEVPEYREIKRLTEKFLAEHGKGPNESEREAIYEAAHHSHGTPAERAHVEALRLDWRKWSAWARGQEAHLDERDPPADVDVRPAPHDHGKLESALDARLGFDAMPVFHESGMLGFDASP